MSPASILLAAALLCAPGAALSLLVIPPERPSLSSQVALIVPFGFVVVGLESFVLTLLHVLTLPSFLGVYLMGTVTLWAVVWRRRSWGPRWQAWRSEVWAEPWTFGAAALSLVALAATRLTYAPVLNLADQTPLRYWADAVEIADAHRIPALSLQWGHLFPSTVSKVVLNTFGAAESLVLGRGPLGPMGALLVVGSIGLLVAAFALARELGLRLTAPVVAVALFANHVLGPRSMTDDLVNYRAESWGRLIMLAALILGVRALRDRRPVDALISGAMFGVAAGTHLVPCLVGLAFLGAYAIGLGAFDRRTVLSVARTAAAAVAAAAAVGVFVLLSPRGDIGFQGAGDTSVYQRLDAELGLPASFDPTRFLALGEIRQQPHRGAFYEPPGSVYHEYVRRVVGEDRLRRPFLVLLPAGGLLALFVLLRWGGPPRRAMAVASAATASVILLVALAFSYRFDVYVLAEFGPRRLFDYTAIPAVLMAAGVMELGLERWAGRRAAVIAAAGVIALTAFAVPRNVSSSSHEGFFASALSPLAWVESHVPCDGRVLADRRTLATLETLTRHAGTIEGMGPYLRPTVLATAIRSLLDARAFFRDPAANEDYLRRNGIASVVVTTYDQTLGGVGGPLKVAPNPTARVAAAPFLHLVASSPTVQVFAVDGFRAGGVQGVDVRRLPGYRCGAS